MHWLQRITAVLSILASSAVPVAASNVSDHWWTPSESGWGVSVTQQDDIAFIVLFVHGPSGQPTWLQGVGTRYGYDMERNPGFAGPLYRTTGPWHGGSFDPAAVGTVQVGNVTFESNGTDSAALEYTVDGVRTIKALRRLTFRQDDWSGLYFGAVRAGYRACAPTFVPAFNYDTGFVEIDHAGSAFTLTLLGGHGACRFTGTHAQHGRLGTVQGTYACDAGPSGDFTLKGLESNERTFGARLSTTHPMCGEMSLDVAATRLVSD